ncbi:hypothetical protein FQR65_LT02533 [Abscondita terminalis]|nr:hypothetical protein FQR65_LT02533 [Abscondita terminalis]
MNADVGQRKLINNVIQATIIEIGQKVLIPHEFKLIQTDLPFQLKRIQFPARLDFAITINESQGSLWG